MVIVPIKPFAAFKEEIVLDGQTYICTFFWNVRGEYWSMTIQDAELNVLIAGMKLVNRYAFLKWYPDRGLPKGMMVTVDTTENHERLAYEDMTNDRCSLVYITETEYETL